MAESRMKGRVRGLLGGPGQDNGLVEQRPAEPHPVERDHGYDGPGYAAPAPSFVAPDAQRRALQVLAMAQKTADEHIASAQSQAEEIQAKAKAAAEKVAQDAAAQAEKTRRDAEKTLVDAKAKAVEIAKDAQAKAAALEKDAQQRYDDVVGTLETKRAALQEQIDKLQQFDRDYRARLRTFMEGQLKELGTDEPRADAKI